MIIYPPFFYLPIYPAYLQSTFKANSSITFFCHLTSNINIGTQLIATMNKEMQELRITIT